MYAGNARPLRSARLSHEIMLLSTKGMNVQNVITLPTQLSERDSAFEEAVVPRGQGIHYEVLYVFDCDYCCCFIYCYSSRFVGNTINIFLLEQILEKNIEIFISDNI